MIKRDSQNDQRNIGNVTIPYCVSCTFEKTQKTLARQAFATGMIADPKPL